MKRRKGVLLWLVGLPLFLGVAAHWGLYFLAVDWLETTIRQLPPDIHLAYREVRTTLWGDMEIGEARLRLPGVPAPLEMKRVEIRVPSVPVYLLRNNPLFGFGPPAFLELRIPSIRLSLERVPAKADDGCDLEEGLSFQSLKRLGFPQLEGTFEARYHYRPSLSALQATLQARIEGIEKVSFETRLQNVTDQGLRNGQLATAMLSMAVLKVNLQHDFGRRLVRYCAAEHQLTPAAMEARFAALVAKKLRERGVLPGPDLEAALQNYVGSWGSLELALIPPVPMSLAFIPFVPPEQLHDKLGFEMLINGDPVQGVRLGKLAVAGENGKETVAHRLRPKVLRRRWVYEAVEPRRLSRFVGHRVRLQERGDPVRSGVLAEVREGKAVVEQRVRGGRFMAYLSLKELVRSEVLVRKVVEEPVTP